MRRERPEFFWQSMAAVAATARPCALTAASRRCSSAEPSCSVSSSVNLFCSVVIKPCFYVLQRGTVWRVHERRGQAGSRVYHFPILPHQRDRVQRALRKEQALLAVDCKERIII